MDYNKDNVFFKILQGDIPAKKVYEDKDVLAFHDIDPKAPVHVLVIPKKPIATFGDLCDEEPLIIGTFFQKVHKVSDILGVSGGYKLSIHNGSKGGQEVFHIHAHITSEA